MSKTVVRCFLDFLEGQEEWLGNMARRGYRLKKCGEMTYTFDKYEPSEYEYAVEFAGDRVYSKAKDYRKYFESMSFRVLIKNIGPNFPYGGVRWWLYAKGTGQIVTSPGGFNKELSILEEKGDGKSFELHTDTHDKRNSCKAVRRAYAWAVLMVVLLGVMTFTPNMVLTPALMIWALRVILLIFGDLSAVPTAKCLLLI